MILENMLDDLIDVLVAKKEQYVRENEEKVIDHLENIIEAIKALFPELRIKDVETLLKQKLWSIEDGRKLHACSKCGEVYPKKNYYNNKVCKECRFTRGLKKSLALAQSS